MPEATKPLAAANLRLGVTIEQALFQGGWFARVGGGVEGEEEGWKGRWQALRYLLRSSTEVACHARARTSVMSLPGLTLAKAASLFKSLQESGYVMLRVQSAVHSAMEAT
jgi:hypothetical protein